VVSIFDREVDPALLDSANFGCTRSLTARNHVSRALLTWRNIGLS